MYRIGKSSSPRRGLPETPVEADDTQVTQELEIGVADVSPATAGKSSRIRRGVVAGVLVGTLSAATLFGYAFTARGNTQSVDSEYLSAEAAVPAAALEAAEEGFADRSEDSSRSTIRTSLSDAVADDSASSEREALIEESVDDASQAYAEMTAEERETAMEEDLKAVEAQEAKLQEEAAAAAERLEEARRALEANGIDASDISAEDLAAIADDGGSMPVKSNYRIGSGFGATGSWSRYHTGQDFPAPTGTPIYAVASGIVLSPTDGSWAGTNVVITHINGGSTLYAHMSSSVVSPGEAVTAGQLIGYVGNTGRSFGSHLHLEYYNPGVTPGDVYSASNPLTFMRGLGINI